MAIILDFTRVRDEWCKGFYGATSVMHQVRINQRSILHIRLYHRLLRIHMLEYEF